MTPSELQLKINKIIDKSFKPTREQQATSILTIVHSLNFESVLSHALKARFECDDIEDLDEKDLDQLFQIARTWRYQADTNGVQKPKAVVVNFRGGDV